ncbi:hypothetical protein ACER0C_002356 [Sarotherodon galilaeus]
MLGYKLNSHKGQYPPWRRRLEGKTKVARREVSQLTELQKEPAKVYSQWQGNNKRTAPPRLETEQYWKSIWEKDATQNGNAQWLVDLRADHSDLPEQGPVTITVADIQERVSNMKSWTAPGPDMVHAYWLKKLTALHECLAAQMNQLLVNERHPEWLTEGRTVLIPKDPKKGPVPSNYRPITCLSTTWKLLSGIILAKMNRHMGQYMSGAQKGIGKNTRGAKHQLLVDRTVSRDCKTRRTNLCTAWIDYKKACAPQLDTGMPRIVQDQQDPKSLHQELNGDVAYNTRGQLQAHSTSLNPLSEIINKTGYGYRLRNGAVVSHLVYMDDIKLYAKSERDMDSLIHTTRLYSNDIGMSFGLEKCSRMVTKKGKVVRTEGIELLEGNIADIEDSYKYLGIPQVNGNHEEAARKAATTKYLQRVRQVLRSQLNGKNKIRVINTYALTVIRYPAGVIGWPKEEIEATDIKTRKLLTMHGGFHQQPEAVH